MRVKLLCAAVIVIVLCSCSFGADIPPFTPDMKDSQVMPPNNFICQTMLAGNKLVSFRSWIDIPYMANSPEPEYNRLNVYVPEEYFHEGGTINGYTAKTAPILLPNGVGGYMPSRQFVPANDNRHGGPNIALAGLAHGYVVVSPAIRGRTLANGKAPALIVDYKAAVRWLRHNKDLLPAGDTEKIISDGLSAGGALSSLLGATGNAKEYEPYLKEVGAYDERDDIFASAVYCPITNLENADMPYEWIFNGVNTYHLGPAREMDDNMKAASEALKAAFPAYLNGLKLEGYTLDENGNGTFREYIEGLYVSAAQKALDAGENVMGLGWLTVEGGKVTGVDLGKYAVWATRMKAAPAFDSLNMKSYENNEFGDKHFTEYSFRHSTAENPVMADAEKIYIMNPMNFIGKEGVKTAKFWRIRHGVKDRDTSLAVPAILALKLNQAGYNADVAAVWGVPHDGNYDLPELFGWIDSICK
ncbi:MAG: hypothetical protein IJG36_01235 [Synergistaceae bacterium]|nr:hypothetical protein [Synergistaceae bacterium]